MLHHFQPPLHALIAAVRDALRQSPFAVALAVHLRLCAVTAVLHKADLHWAVVLLWVTQLWADRLGQAPLVAQQQEGILPLLHLHLPHPQQPHPSRQRASADSAAVC